MEFLHQNDPTAYALNILTDDVPKDYDLIIANAVFLHFTDDEAQRALTKAFNALKSGGTLAITLKEGEGESWQENKGMKARYFNYWSKEDITNLIVSTGFTTVDVWLSPSGDSSVNWIMITAKK